MRHPLEHQRPPSVDREPPLARLMSPLSRFLGQSTTGGLLVLLASLSALVLANSPLGPGFRAWLDTDFRVAFGTFGAKLSLLHLINDGLMALFFLVVGLELKEAFFHGELRDPRRARLPAAAALGGMLVPALLYTAFHLGGPGRAGWAIPMATDIAFALGILRLVPSVPAAALTFLAALAIVDDLGAVLVIALFYNHGLNPWPLALLALLVLSVIIAGRAGLRHPLPYVLAGLALWGATIASGIHASIAGVILAVCLPSGARVDADRTIQWTARFARAELKTPNSIHTIEALAHGIARGRSPLAAWSQALSPWVNLLIVPLFALANAGVVFPARPLPAADSWVALGVLIGLCIGKPLGVLGASWLVLRLGWARLPTGLNPHQLLPLGILSGVGFTMALFIAELAFGATPRLDAAKLGILAASFAMGLAGYWLARRSYAR